jgi:N6-L-threonylcarbamoyladenine synthase
MRILAIETSCDDTCAAVLEDDRVIKSVISSQTEVHRQWGGVVPNLAKMAHQENIGWVISAALGVNKNNDFNKRMSQIDTIVVTAGPGLAPALEVGVNEAKKLGKEYHIPITVVNHVEGHILSNWVKNVNGKPERNFEFPLLALTVSGGHSKIVLAERVGEYKTIGETLDDAAGEALDKAAKLLGLGYPGGPVIERLAMKGDKDFLKLPQPLMDKKILDYSFSGLKTSFYYKIKDWPKGKVEENLNNLAASFQEAVLETLVRKFKLAAERYKPKMLTASGGVMANRELRKKLRRMAKELGLKIYFPEKKWLNTDNAAMIGVAGYYKALRSEQVENTEDLERKPRWEI